jgi:tRNA-2-methylthio-N6-dimethylallyladenosine synthase
VQAGDNEILVRMNRRYTRESYLDQIKRLRDACPDIAISSDIIVGFPGETERQFQASLKLIETVRYDGLFAFMYSDRPHAPAAAFSGKVTEAVKKERLQSVLDLQSRITQEKYQAMVGTTCRVLVEGPSRRFAPDTSLDGGHKIQWSGRSSSNHIIHFVVPGGASDGKEMLTGTFANIMIDGAYAHSLWGRLIDRPMGDRPHKGETIIAA